MQIIQTKQFESSKNMNFFKRRKQEDGQNGGQAGRIT